MTSFYPGPSQVHEEISRWVKKAQKKGLLSINHRSARFETLAGKTIQLLHHNLKIPGDYQCFFTSSATECWEIIAQSLIDQHSYHLINGAFGKKWHQYTKLLKPKASVYEFNSNEVLAPEIIDHPIDTELIAITQNETSNGTQVTEDVLLSLKKHFPNCLLALDATSSLGGIELPWSLGDVWFASVQKCLGLPAGMGLLICSPRALKRAGDLGEDLHYNSLNNLVRHMKNRQTTHTPNVLAIYLLFKALQKSGPIDKVHQEVKSRFSNWMDFVANLSSLKPLIKNPAVRSHTVITLQGSTTNINRILKHSKENGFIIGKGYGDLKSTTLRLANFPAIKQRQITAIQELWKASHF